MEDNLIWLWTLEEVSRVIQEAASALALPSIQLLWGNRDLVLFGNHMSAFIFNLDKYVLYFLEHLIAWLISRILY